MHHKKIIILLLIISFSRVYSLEIKNIYFIPSFSYSNYLDFNFYGGGLSIDKDFSVAKRFSLNIGLTYSMHKAHFEYTVDSTFLKPSATSGNTGYYYQNRQLSQIFIPINIKYFLTESNPNKLSISLGLTPTYFIKNKGEGTYYIKPNNTQAFDPGPYTFTNDNLAGRLFPVTVTNSLSLDYCYALSSKLAINLRATIMKGFYTSEQPLMTFLGIGIKLL